MHTKDKLAAELRRIGLYDIADLAAKGHYHDFLSTLLSPSTQLQRDLLPHYKKPGVSALMHRHTDGEFDASRSEADTYYASKEGKAAFERVAKAMTTKRRPKASKEVLRKERIW